MTNEASQVAVTVQLAAMRKTLQAINAASAMKLDELQMAGIALYLQNLHGGIENILLRFLEYRGIARPVGENWHITLLQIFATPSSNLPTLLPTTYEQQVQTLRSFRHPSRNIYGVDLDWSRIEPIVRKLPEWLPDWLTQVEAMLKMECSLEKL